MKNVVEYLEKNVRRHGGEIACADPDSACTFAELRDRARRAGSMFARLAEQATPIAFLMDKSVKMLAGFLGAAYAGCCYAALNPQLPPARLQQILDTLNPALVVTNGPDRADGLSYAGTVLNLDDALACGVDDTVIERRQANAIDTDPLYVMFTSGSTGVPKGVAVSHRGVIDFIDNFVPLFSIGKDDVLGNQAQFDFDISVKDIYSCMASGARLEILPRRLFSFPAELARHLRQRKVTTLIWAVSALRLAATKDAFGRPGREWAVDKVLFSGEPIPPKLLRYWQDFFPGAAFVNLYGPTEITCNCAYHVVDRRYDDGESIPMGRAYPNKRLYLLAEDDRPVTEPGETGEICVAGSGLALGYYGRDDLSEAVFRRNPLHGQWRERIYHTGDLGRYGADGLLYYAGRKDFQIKHNGHRIEMGDIESAATAAAGVSGCCCVYHEGVIVMFYQGDAAPGAVASAVRKRLPAYMAPGKIFRLDSLPVTANGKFDRPALLRGHCKGGDMHVS